MDSHPKNGKYSHRLKIYKRNEFIFNLFEIFQKNQLNLFGNIFVVYH